MGNKQTAVAPNGVYNAGGKPKSPHFGRHSGAESITSDPSLTNGAAATSKRQQQHHRDNKAAHNKYAPNYENNNYGGGAGMNNSYYQYYPHAPPPPPNYYPPQNGNHYGGGGGGGGVNGSTPTKQRNFLQQLFTKAPNIVDATAYAQMCPPPVGGEMPIGENATLLRDRPALRLDSRLVCKYEVLSVVGKGSFSQVLRVQHRVTRLFYAVKLVSIDSDFGAVNNELSILGRVQHPYVIRLEEVFRGASKLFIVMEMASGGEMYDRVVTKGRYTEAEARHAVLMLLNGLAYLHGIHVTHRDLKPENLLYSDDRPDARLLITDFGLAHQAKNADEKMVETCGTPEYIAPEILLRIPYTNKVDMWAVGVIAYILMSGIMPFDDDNRSRLYSHIITADYIYYPMFWAGSELAKQFVDDLLETNVEQRLSAAEALHHDWVLGAERKRQTQQPELNVSIKARQRQPSISDDHSMQRTKSTRSIRSVTRSDHGHRVDPREVDKLAEDLERLAKSRRARGGGGADSQSTTKDYGVF